MMRPPTSIAEAKKQARQLRQDLQRQGEEITHAKALECIAHRQGFRDWNAFSAAAGKRPSEDWRPGGRVEGRYLSQPFRATVLDAQLVRPGWFRLVLDLDEAVDVVTFDSFSCFRKRIRAVVGPEGYSKEQTSNGAPHVLLKM